MFPRLRRQLLARADLLVELSTLGEYGLDEDGRVMALSGDTQAVEPAALRELGMSAGCGSDPFGQCDSEPAAIRRLPRTRDRCAGGDDSLGCDATAGRGAATRP